MASECTCKCGHTMTLTKLDSEIFSDSDNMTNFLRTCLSARACWDCRRLTPMSEDLFHCSRCETNLCTQCANARRVKPVLPLMKLSQQDADASQKAMSHARQGPNNLPRNGRLDTPKRHPEIGQKPNLPASNSELHKVTSRNHPTKHDVDVSEDIARNWNMGTTSRSGSELSSGTSTGNQSTSRSDSSISQPLAKKRSDSLPNRLGRKFMSCCSTNRLSSPERKKPISNVRRDPTQLEKKSKDVSPQLSFASTTIGSNSSCSSRSSTAIKVSIATTVEWIFLDENELFVELGRFSVPCRHDESHDRRTRTPDKVHCSWCPCGSSCAEHGGRTWCGHKGCPYSIPIRPQPVASIMTPFVDCDSPNPRNLPCNSMDTIPFAQAQASYGFAPVAGHWQQKPIGAAFGF